MEVAYPARDVFYSQRHRPDTVVRVSVESGVLVAPPRVVLDLVLIRGLREGERKKKEKKGLASGTRNRRARGRPRAPG